MHKLFALLFLILTTSSVQAESSFYGELRLGAGGVRHSNTDFFPGYGGLTGGFFLTHNIGVEAFVEFPLGVGAERGFDVRIPMASGVAARFQSPSVNGVEGYIVLGFTTFELEQENRNDPAARTITGDFTGVRTSIGVQQHLSLFPGFLVALEYRNVNTDSGITTDGLSLGLRVEFQ